MSIGRSTKHKVIFALIVITTVLLIVWAGYINYKDVAVERNATIMADLLLYEWKSEVMEHIINIGNNFRADPHLLLEYNNRWSAICLTPQEYSDHLWLTPLSAYFQGTLFA